MVVLSIESNNNNDGQLVTRAWTDVNIEWWIKSIRILENKH